jgi:hypothetical protein
VQKLQGLIRICRGSPPQLPAFVTQIANFRCMYAIITAILDAPP